MDLYLLLDSIFYASVIVAIVFVISYLKGKAESSLTWFVGIMILLLGTVIYYMR